MIPKAEGVERSESEDRFATLFYCSPVAHLLSARADGRMLDVNEAYCQLVGYRREELIGRTTLELGLWADPQDRLKIIEAYQRDGRVRGLEMAIRTRSGEIRQVEASFEETKLNGIDCFISTALDITERRLAEHALVESERMFRHLTRMTSDLFYTCLRDDDGFFRVRWLGGDAMRPFGISNEELKMLGCWRGFVIPEDQALFDRNTAGLQPGQQGRAELRAVHRDGSVHHLRCFSEVALDSQGRHRLFGAIEDITERVRLEQQLEYQAHTDSLTGLVNRGHFIELAVKELSRARRYGYPVALAMLDLDYFKAINDSHGHEVGDRVLQQFAALCRDSLRDSDLLARIGGEEFVILFPETTCAAALEVAERIRAATAQAGVAATAGPTVYFTTSIGITEFADVDAGIDALLSRADRALYDAKRSGRNRSCVLPSP
jgi:diguanylate cyclase (GGDEF)-like protein/PAS domain S-box-containing protein